MEGVKKSFFFKLGTVIILAIVVQSFLQNGTELKNILGTFMGYMKPFTYSIFITIILLPLVTYIEKKTRLKRIYSIPLAVMVIFLIITLILLVTVPGIIDSFAELKEKMPSIQDRIELTLNNAIHYLEGKGINFPNAINLKIMINDWVKENLDLVRNFFKSLSLNLLGFALTVGQFLIGLVIAIYIIFDKEYFRSLSQDVLITFTGKEKTKKNI